MAELSTIARPYAQGLWNALQDHKADSSAAEALASMRDARSKDLYRKAATDYPASSYAAQAKAKM